ncbi:uncharacterized protein LOC118646676 [Monomorium pharaonis]|uniref:uncharacterized protein LOC118646676 n=1 Tax=Monomorium pharaonis TaxID=307658 RepID=UPI00174735BB|nr:uncharacterized protein LOC118646676 [Monomorium pharaonis]
MDCIHFTISAYNNSFREMKYNASTFVQDFLHSVDEISFASNLFWTDEATFTPNGVFNSCNSVKWADENPHAIRQIAFQYRWAINVWAGVIDERLHDGAPAHFSRRVREILDDRYPNRWMGRGGPIAWPPRSPDLNVLDYFVWGHIKAKVEHMRERTEVEVREAITAFNTVTPDMIRRATQQIVRRAELCLDAQEGKHFKQLLH